MATKRTTQAPADHYTYRLAWSAKDAEFIVTVVEVLRDMLAEGQAIPVPWASGPSRGSSKCVSAPTCTRGSRSRRWSVTSR